MVQRTGAGRKAEVFDADLSAYFDTIPHKELLQLVGKRISDKNVLHLIKMWLKTPVMDNGRLTGGKKNKLGTPQGGVISPLLANIYLHEFDKAVNRENGVFYQSGIKIIRYADDWVLMARRIPQSALDYLDKLLKRMKLKLNVEKSKVVNAFDESFDFLGHTFRLDDDVFGRRYRKYWNVEPSSKSQMKVRDKIREYLRHNGHQPPQEVANDLNTITRGWIRYFTIKGVTFPGKAKRNLRYYLRGKLTRYYKRKSQRKCKLHNQGAFTVLVGKYGLIAPRNTHLVDDL